MYKLLLSALLLAPSLAHADPAKQLATDLGAHFNYWTTYRDDPGSRASMLEHDPKPDACATAVEKARKAGLGNDARIYHSEFSSWDEAHYDEKKTAYLQLSEIDQLCKQWPKMILLAPVAAFQTKVAQTQHSFSLVEPGSLGKDMGDVFVKDAKECLAVTDSAIKSGAPADHKVKIRDQVMSIREGRAKVCQAFLDWATSLGGKVKEAHAADHQKRAAPYKAVGVAGAKLELFVEYDDVYWRGGANCQRISDIKQLAKAKALFQWLENPDGTHTIRKYTFKGNKVSGPTSKTFKDAGAAQRGCK